MPHRPTEGAVGTAKPLHSVTVYETRIIGRWTLTRVLELPPCQAKIR